MAWSQRRQSQSSRRSVPRPVGRGRQRRLGPLPNGRGTDSEQAHHSSKGFTLIEMLMSVTLVLIMMVMFAEVFQVAGNSVTKQRTLADNDQNARTLFTIIRGDLDKRTFRTAIPFYTGEPPASSATPFNNRRGYFYISNNALGDGTDDVLQFTVMSTSSLKNADESPYYGAAVQLPFPAPAAWSANPAQGVYNFLQHPNQPDRDDGQIISNGAASSRAAEVSYFMRGGRLYRRVMLIRDPIPAAGVDPTNPSQPATAQNVDYFNPANTAPLVYTGNFWGQFDFSAFRTPTILNTAAGTPICARFTGLDFLRNDLPIALAGYPYCYSLGQTWNRFGHNHEILANNVNNGMPREFSAPTTPNFFIGRFTHEETSNTGFQYPQFIPAGGNPMDATATTFADTTPADGVIDTFAGGSRAGVDLLLSNVHEFRVEVWDDRTASFEGIGHTKGVASNPGDYGLARQLNNTYGPLGGSANVYDTWYPLFDRDGNGALGNVPDRPPYRPLTWNPTLPAAFTGYPPGPTPPGIPFPSLRGYWAPGTPYSFGDVVFPLREDLNGNGFLDPGEDGSNGFASDGKLQENVRIGTEDVNYNGILDMGEDTNMNMMLDLGAPAGLLTEDLNWNGVLDAGEDGAWGFPTGNPGIDSISLRLPNYPTGLTLAYQCIRAGTSGPTRLDEPNRGAWSMTPGQILRDPSGNGPDWIVVYNARPLRAIRITVRYQHPVSQQMKQVTLVHSLRDNTSVP